MKHSAVFFFGIILLSATCSNDNDNCHNTITIINNSEKAIYFYSGHGYPDTTIIDYNPYDAGAYYLIKKKSIHKNIKNDCFEYDFNLTPKLMYFIYDACILETTPWDTIKAKYIVLKRYDLSLQDLQQMNWTITYP